MTRARSEQKVAQGYVTIAWLLALLAAVLDGGLHFHSAALICAYAAVLFAAVAVRL